MAVTIARVGRTQHRLRYLVTQDGAGGTTATLTQAQMTDDANLGAAAGPLREAFRRPVVWGDILFTMGNNQASKIEANVVPRSGAAAALAVIFATGPNVMQVTAPAAASVWILEFKYTHSINN